MPLGRVGKKNKKGGPPVLPNEGKSETIVSSVELVSINALVLSCPANFRVVGYPRQTLTLRWLCCESNQFQSER